MKFRSSQVVPLFLSAVVFVAAPGCDFGDGDGLPHPFDPDTVSMLLVQSVDGPTQLEANRSLQLRAVGLNGGGVEVALGAVTWSSSDITIATVDEDGVVTGRASGNVDIRANTGGKSASLGIAVRGAYHEGDITDDETWRASDNPHRIGPGSVYVDGSGTPVLTIEAGVEVRFEADTSLTVGSGEAGQLKVLGTADAPVRFTANASEPNRGHYLGLVLGEAVTHSTSIQHLTLEYCGGGGSNGAACLVLEGERLPLLKNVRVAQSASEGFHFAGGGLADGSTQLVATECDGFPVRFGDANHVGSLPKDSLLTGNARDAITIDGGQVKRSQTWWKHTVPYALYGEVDVDGDTGPVLTIEKGATLRFNSNGLLTVAWFNVPGTLIAVGTAEEPITFTSDAEEPSPGDWPGLQIGNDRGGSTRLEYVVVSYGGANHANIAIDGDTNGAFIENSVISHSAHWGITLTDSPGVGFATDFTAGHGNTFSDNASGDQTGP